MNDKRFICYNSDAHIDIIIDIDACNPEIICVEELAKKFGHKIDYVTSDPLTHRYYSKSAGEYGRELYTVDCYHNSANELFSIHITRYQSGFDDHPKKYFFDLANVCPVVALSKQYQPGQVLTDAVARYFKWDEEAIASLAKEIINNTHKEVNKMAKNGFTGTFKMEYFYDTLPQPKLVMTNSKNGKDYVTVVWKDGSHTVICRAENDPYDIDKAIMFAVMKKMCSGNGCEMDRYFEKFKKCQVVSGEKGV